MGPIGIFGSGGLAPSGADSLLLAHDGILTYMPLRAAYGIGPLKGPFGIDGLNAPLVNASSYLPQDLMPHY